MQKNILRSVTVIAILMSVTLLAAPLAAPQKSVWDGVYTADQATRGQKTYDAECSRCHELSSFAGKQFMDAWKGQTAGDLYDNISSAMPMDAPGKLDKQQYVDIVTYMFKLNEFPAGQEELKADKNVLQGVKIEPKPAH